jgi:ATP-binding cassette subfamily B protein/subfamily B ATP-binding cassette protein MsbA
MGALRGPRPSRHRYHDFRRDYRQQRLDDASRERQPAGTAESPDQRRGKRRQYVREYLRWLRPHRFAVATVFVLALVTAGLQMIEPLFIRFIIDRVLLNTALDTRVAPRPPPSRGPGLPGGGSSQSSLFGVLKDYRQRLLNVRVMLSLRQSLVPPATAPAAAQTLGHEDLAASCRG